MEITTAVHASNWNQPADVGAPVALLLHGYGSHEGDLPGLAQWLPAGMPWVSPRAPLPLRSMGMGYAWFPLSLPELPAPADIEDATAALWSWVDAEIGPDRPLVLLGFSQGALMALQLLRTRPERIVATVVLAGLITAEPQPADARLSDERPPVFWARGEADAVVPAEGVTQLSAFLPRHSTLTERVYPGLGHSVDERVVTDMQQFLSENVSPSHSD